MLLHWTHCPKLSTGKRTKWKIIALDCGRGVRYGDDMKALTEKWHTVERIALDMGVKPDTVRKWKEPGRGIPAHWHIRLVANSKRKLKIDDFMEDDK